MPIRFPHRNQTPDQIYTRPPEAHTQRPLQQAASRLKSLVQPHSTRLLPAYVPAAELHQRVAAAPDLSGLRPLVRQTAALDKAFHNLAKKRAPALHPSRVTLVQDPTLHSVGTPAACRTALAALFPQDADDLHEALANLPPDPTLGSHRQYNRTLLLATALRQASNADPVTAMSLLQELRRDPATPPPGNDIVTLAHTLRRDMAQTSMEALLHLQGRSPGPTERLAEQSALKICAWLQAQPGGLPPGEHVGSLGDFVAHARAQPYIGRPPGGDDDNALQLAHQALVAADDVLNGRPPVDVQRHALLAWQHGYQTSGRDAKGRLQPFNRMLKRLSGFKKHFDRAAADHATATWKCPFVAGFQALQRIFGKNKQLLGKVHRLGTQGAVLSELNVAGPKFRDDLGGILLDISTRLQTQLDTLNATLLPPERESEKARATILLAVSQLWSEAGVKNVRLDDATVLQRCQELNAANPQAIDFERPECRKLLHSLLPRRGRAEASVPLKLKHLEAMVGDLYRPAHAQDLRKAGNSQVSNRIATLTARITELEAQIPVLEAEVDRLRQAPGNAVNRTELNNATRTFLERQTELLQAEEERPYVELMHRIQQLRCLANGGRATGSDRHVNPSPDDLADALTQLARSDNTSTLKAGSTRFSIHSAQGKPTIQFGKKQEAVHLAATAGNADTMDFLLDLARSAQPLQGAQIWAAFADRFPTGAVLTLTHKADTAIEKLRDGRRVTLQEARDDHGRLVPECTHSDIRFPDVRDLAAHLNTQRAQLPEDMVFTALDGAEHRGLAAVDQFLREASLQTQGPKHCTVHRSLKNEVAGQIDDLQNQAQLLIGHGPVDLRPALTPVLARRLQEIQDSIQALYAQPDSWTVQRLSVSVPRQGRSHELLANTIQVTREEPPVVAESEGSVSIAGSEDSVSDTESMPSLEPDSPRGANPGGYLGQLGSLIMSPFTRRP